MNKYIEPEYSSTIEEFQKFCEEHYCIYEYGFGYNIVQLITNDEEFIEFMLKCAIVHICNNTYLPYFLNEQNFEYLDINKELTEDVDEYDDGTLVTDDDVDIIPAYIIYYNSWSEQPFEFHKIEKYPKIKSSLFSVNPEVKKKFPAVVKCYSVDSFDRLGTIKGCTIDIIPLNEIENMTFI